MGITQVALVDEDSSLQEQVTGDTHLLDELLEKATVPNSCCLRFIDFYGDTVFNNLQMESFLAEWRSVEQLVRSEAERQLSDAVQSLAARCAREPHTYLKFSGD